MQTDMADEESAEYILELVESSTYEVYLATNYWRNLRERAFSELGRSCRVCTETGSLHVHHKTYERLGRERVADLEILCERCHQEKHPHRHLGAASRHPIGQEYAHDDCERLDPQEWWSSQVGEWEDNLYEAAEPGERLVSPDVDGRVDEEFDL
jgi:HNH endonuclease